MRLTRVCCGYFKKYVEYEMRRKTGYDVRKPLYGWIRVGKKRWKYDQNHPITDQSFLTNISTKDKEASILIEPVKDWKIFRGDRGYQIKMAEGDHVPEGVLCGVGNPLLDITIIADQSFLDKYGLQSNDAIIATERHDEMFEHMVKNCEPKYLAGGATQNSIRVAQWLLQIPKATSFIGGAGNDVFHDILLKTAEEVGVDVKYEIHKDMSTGKCGAIIVGEDRSLVTDLGAAEHFTAQFLQEPEIWQLLEKARIFYIGGFIIPVSSEAVLRVAKYAAENNKIVVMNLHARFLCKHFADPKLNLMQYVDVLFGNGDEAKKLGECYGFDSTDVREIALKAEALPKVNEKRKRTIVFTQGRDPTVLAHDGQIVEFPIDAVKKDLIKDTNGCGDAFVGGFLSQLAQNKDLDTCMKCGFYASKVVIQHYGCNFSNTPDFKC